MKRLFLVLVILVTTATAFSACFSGFAAAQGVLHEMAAPERLTLDSHYDRDPSFFKANDGTYWLFFARAVDGTETGAGCDDGWNCDAATYDIYYMTSGDSGSTWSSETLMSDSITGFTQRVVAALQDGDGNIWVFVSSGSSGTDQSIYYYISEDEGASWSDPVAIQYEDSPVTGGQIDALEDSAGVIWVFYSDSGTSYVTTNDDGATWSEPELLDVDGSIPKAFVDGNNDINVVVIHGGNGVYRWVHGGDWEGPQEIANSEEHPIWGDYDPVLYQHGNGVYRLYWAPYDDTAKSQWIQYVSSSDGTMWTPATLVTKGRYDETDYWWDFWPEVFEDTGTTFLFITSERSNDGTERIDGNIWLIKMRWPVENDIGRLREAEKTVQTLWNGLHIQEEEPQFEWLWDKVFWMQDHMSEEGIPALWNETMWLKAHLYVNETGFQGWLWDKVFGLQDVFYWMKQWQGFSAFWAWYNKPACPYECCAETEYKSPVCPEAEVCSGHQCVPFHCEEDSYRCSGSILQQCVHNEWATTKSCMWGCESSRCKPAMSSVQCYNECVKNHNYVEACFQTYSWMRSYSRYCPQ
jgi:hypothetical protein